MTRPIFVDVVNPKTPADLFLERYLNAHGVEFSYEPDISAELGIEAATKPDYLVSTSAGRAVCEVAQMETRTLTRRLAVEPRGVLLGQAQVFGPMRHTLVSKANQLRPLAGCGVPLVIALANSPAGSDFPLDDEQVPAALWGNPKVTFAIEKRTGAAVGDYRHELRDYGAFCSLRPDGSWENLHPHVSAVVTLHERTREQDWIEELYARSRPRQGDVEARWASVVADQKEIERARAAGEIPEGGYHWVEVYELDGAEAELLPADLFTGERDRHFGFDGDGGYGERLPES